MKEILSQHFKKKQRENLLQKLLVHIGRLQDLAVFIEKCLTSAYFLFQGENYKQIFDTPMSSPLSLVADILMEIVKVVVLKSFSRKPKTSHRYVDDIFII